MAAMTTEELLAYVASFQPAINNAGAYAETQKQEAQDFLIPQYDALLDRFQQGFSALSDVDDNATNIRNTITGWEEGVGYTQQGFSVTNADGGSVRASTIMDAYGYNKEAFTPIQAGTAVSSESVTNAYKFLNEKISGGATLDGALSEWYGTDINIAEATPSKDKHLYGAVDGTAFGEFNAIARGILNVTAPFAMTVQDTTANSDWLYNHDPMLRAVYESYGIDPYRSTGDGSTYIYDPLVGTYRTHDAGDENWVKPLATTIMTGVFTAMGGIAGAGIIGGATGQAIGAGVTSGAITAAEGGDTGDILTSAILSGAAGYASGAADAADAATSIADAATAAGAANAESLTNAATLLADQAALADTIANSAHAINAVINEDYLGALSYGLDAANLPSPREWATGQFASLVDPTGSGLVAGTFDTQPLGNAAWKLSTSLADGKDAQSALLSALRVYVQDGGTLNTNGAFNLDIDFDLPDSTFLAQFDSSVLSSLEDAIRQAGSFIDDTVLQPIGDFGSLIDDAVLQPVKEGIEELLEAIPSPDIDLNLPSMPDIELDFSGVAINLPEFDLDPPDIDINLPELDIDINLPDTDLDLGDIEGIETDIELPDIDLPLELLGLLATPGVAAANLTSTPNAAKSNLTVSDTVTKFQGKSKLLEAMLEADPLDDLAPMDEVSTDGAA